MSGEDQFECELGVDDSEKFGPLYWMVRPCEWYKQEYSDCKSIRARVHQYFINGHTDSCEDWQNDYNNCFQYRKTKDPILIRKIIASELIRKEKRFERARENKVWKYRDEPPSDWNKPLSD
ncbi:UPF0545 protein C22orf39 -like protein [Sarcoptes scabiei]|uniref:Synaptic plasticity regulator PANTS n=1 Tax=Sarcoptes scabiei TaxID=52283 RepID=A0A132A572_SARSC|nr:UPF0545 protein C22orf39 -like protein [Sarcoptes scabiei]KPM06108.1 hypothetical protein QR98_0045810 [Sarcoptes scabiei]UXI17876.1 PIN2/TERF1-interacting telomerase inhibitor 1 [Sarcoptes scabiei]